MKHLACAVLALALTRTAAQAQTCGDSFREGFDLFSNQGAWVWSGTFQAGVGSGGVPGYHLRSQLLHLATPQLHSTADSPYTGDYRALEVTSLGIDLQAFRAEAQACQRRLTLMLETDSGTTDPLDDRYVYLVTDHALPCVDGAWHGFTVDVPARELALPAGWRPDPASPLSDDATWNAVIADVSSVRWSLGDPHDTHAPTQWQLGADNPRIAFGRGPSTYCTSKTTSEGCSAALLWFGKPSASGGGFSLRAYQVLENQAGLLFYGLDAASLPFQDGELCVAAPLMRTPVQVAVGSGPCAGRLLVDFNAIIQGGSDPALVAGETVYAQFWGRDPASTSGSSLSNAVRFTICP